MAAVEGASARLVAVTRPVGSVGPPAGAEAGRVAARAAQPVGGTAASGDAAGQGEQRQQGGPARHGCSAPPPAFAPRQPGTALGLTAPGAGAEGEGAGPPTLAPWPRR